MQKTCHIPTLLKVGSGEILLAALYQLESSPSFFLKDRIWIPLNSKLPEIIDIQPFYGSHPDILFLPLKDMSGVAKSWKHHMELLAKRVDSGNYFHVAWCTGGHGRTGTLGASLIALLEPSISNPIQAIRNRYCHEAVETLGQVKGIYDLKGKPVPSEWYKGKISYSLRVDFEEFHLKEPNENQFKEEGVPAYAIDELREWTLEQWQIQKEKYDKREEESQAYRRRD